MDMDSYKINSFQLISLNCMKFGDAPPSIEVKVSTLEGDTTMREEKANPACEEDHKNSEPAKNVVLISGRKNLFNGWKNCRRVVVL